MAKSPKSQPAPRMSLLVPGMFWSDHADRCPCDDPALDMADEIRQVGARVLIEGNARQIECLRSDAEFYCDAYGPDESPAGLVRSARATLAAIRKANEAATMAKAAAPTPDPTDRNRGGRPRIKADSETVLISTRLTTEQKEKLQRLGGAQWLRDRIERAKEPTT